MKNPIPLTSLFITPDSLEQLQHIAESMSNSSEAWRMMVFTLNYCHMMVREAIEQDEAKAEELSVMRDAIAPSKYQLDKYPYSTE